MRGASAKEGDAMGTIGTAKPAAQERVQRTAVRVARGARVEVQSDLERALIGAVGALLPVLAILFTGGLGRLGPELYMNAGIAAVVGAVFAYVQPGVGNRFGVMQIGMSVPEAGASEEGRGPQPFDVARHALCRGDRAEPDL
jgi:hypothetical protein